MAIDRTGRKFGPIWLVPGVSAGNMWALMYACFFTIGLLTFVGTGTPYVLTGILKVPEGEQGGVSGQLVLWGEITQLLMFGPVGLLADRFGRKALFVAGFLLMGLGYGLYPMAGSVAELLVYRVIYSAGVASCTGVLATVVTDYPQEASRGKLVAITGFMNGLGVALLNFALGGMPRRFAEAGADTAAAGQYTFWLVAGICVVSAAIIAWGLKSGTPVSSEKRPPLGELVTIALRQALNPRIALAYSAAFIARGDLVILGTFLTLWAKNAGVADGLELPEASRRATLVFVTAQSWALLSTIAMVFLIDRFNRVTSLAACMFVAAAGYLSMAFVDNPLAAADRPLIILLGIGQISAFFGSQSLVGQEAPLAHRGAVVGGFNTAGAIGILFTSVVGGYLFDALSPKAPFIMVGFFNAVVLVMALIVRWKSPGRMAGEPAVFDTKR